MRMSGCYPTAICLPSTPQAVLDGADVQLLDNSGQSMLHWAVTMGDFKMVRELCKAGLQPTERAKPRGPNSPGHRPVDIAISGSRIADMLREYRRDMPFW